MKNIENNIGNLIKKAQKTIDITPENEVAEVKVKDVTCTINRPEVGFELKRCFMQFFYPLNKQKLEKYIDMHGNDRGKSFEPFVLEFSKNIESKGMNRDQVEPFINFCKDQSKKYDNLNYFDLNNFFIPVLENYHKMLQKARQEAEERRRKISLQLFSQTFESYSDFLNRENKNINGILSKDIESELQLTRWQEQNETNKGCWNVRGFGKNNKDCTNCFNISDCENCENCEHLVGKKDFKNMKEKSIFQKLNEQRKRTTIEEREQEEAEIRRKRREKNKI